jgi:hypothetical protein
MKLTAGSVLAFSTILTLTATAAAQTPAPAFSYGKADDVKDVKAVDWTAVAEAGFLMTTGNSETTTISAGGTATRLDPKNKLVLAVALAYARSNVQVPDDADGNGLIGPGEIAEEATTTANSWQVKLRYDRFLTGFDSLYASGAIGADVPAGKELVGGGQVGYSRRLYKTEKHEVVAEAGYDFTYEDLTVGDPLAIHSARVFSGYKGTVRADTAVEASVEALSNLNTLQTLPEESGPMEDTRVNGIAGLTTKLTAAVSFSFSFTIKYDRAPAPRAPFPGFMYEPGFVPLSDTIDTITKASLIVSLF